MSASTSDRELVARVLCGDPEAAEVFVERFWHFVRSVAMRRLGPAHPAVAEVPQALFVHLWEDDFRRLRSWRGEDDLARWLGPVVRNLAVDLARKAAAGRALPLDDPDGNAAIDPVDPRPGPEALVCLQERREAVHEALALLKERDRQLLECRYLQELDYSEIAVRFEMTLNNAYVALHRAERRLARIVRDRHPELAPASFALVGSRGGAGGDPAPRPDGSGRRSRRAVSSRGPSASEDQDLARGPEREVP